MAANALLVGATGALAELAAGLGLQSDASRWARASAALTAAVNIHLFDEEMGAYRDNPSSTLFPQDGNSLCLWFNVTAGNATRAMLVSDHLVGNWVQRGAVSPEWLYNGWSAIGTFPGSMEVHAHVAAGRADRATQLTLRQWGYMLNSANSTNSTFWEGFQADGQFAFTGVYMSHAHGWASGPAAALSAAFLGLPPASDGGPELSLAPLLPLPSQLGSFEGSGFVRVGGGQAHLQVAWQQVFWQWHSRGNGSSCVAAMFRLRVAILQAEASAQMEQWGRPFPANAAELGIATKPVNLSVSHQMSPPASLAGGEPKAAPVRIELGLPLDLLAAHAFDAEVAEAAAGRCAAEAVEASRRARSVIRLSEAEQHDGQHGKQFEALRATATVGDVSVWQQLLRPAGSFPAVGARGAHGAPFLLVPLAEGSGGYVKGSVGDVSAQAIENRPGVVGGTRMWLSVDLTAASAPRGVEIELMLESLH